MHIDMSSDVVKSWPLKAHFHTQANNRTRALQTHFEVCKIYAKSLCTCTYKRMYVSLNLMIILTIWKSQFWKFWNTIRSYLRIDCTDLSNFYTNILSNILFKLVAIENLYLHYVIKM